MSAQTRVRGTGAVGEVKRQTPRPLKGPQAEHTWVAFVGYRLNEVEIERHRRTQTPLMLGPRQVVMGPEIGCLACEQAYEQARGTPCPGEPPGRLEYVT